MKNLQLIFFFLATISCNQIKQESLASNIQIITKYQTLDEERSPNHHKCSEEIKTFTKMDKYDCSFRLGNFEFDIEKKFNLDESGNLREYWTYLPEGPLTYNLTQLKSDPKFLKSIGGTELNIHLLENNNQIIDKGDTLTIEKIFPNEKLILIEKKGNTKINGRRIIFLYK